MITLTIAIFCLASLLSFWRAEMKNAKSFWWALAGLLLFLLAAFRSGDAVRDYDTFVEIYNNIAQSSIEISFVIIAWIVRHIFFDNVIFVFIIFAALGVSLKLKAIKTLTSLGFLSLVIYISNFYILHELTQIRAGVAAGFLLLSIKPIYERDFRKFLFFSICAVLFHYSALLIFLLWFFKGNSINKYIYATTIPLACVVYFFNINLVELFIPFIPIEHIQQRFTIYTELQKQEIGGFNEINVFNYVFLAKCLIYYVLLWKSDLLKKQNKYAPLLLKIQALSLTSFVLFAAMPVFAFRMSELFGIVEIILIPFLYYVFKPRSLSITAVVFIGLCILLINIFHSDLIIST